MESWLKRSNFFAFIQMALIWNGFNLIAIPFSLAL